MVAQLMEMQSGDWGKVNLQSLIHEVQTLRKHGITTPAAHKMDRYSGIEAT